MQDIRYDRICRTSHSESYLISRGEEPVARVELHYTHTIVHGLLVVEREFDEQEITDLIGKVDEDLVWSSYTPREDFVVTVYQGREMGMYSTSIRGVEEDENGSEEAG